MIVILCCKLNVTINAPACFPRDFDEDVLLTVPSAETDGEDTVAKFAAICVVGDFTFSIMQISYFIFYTVKPIVLLLSWTKSDYSEIV